TNKGNYLYIPVHELPDIRWKDIGQHVSNLIPIDNDDHIIQALPIRKFTKDHYLVFLTKNGLVKRSELALYDARRYSRPFVATNLMLGDALVNVYLTDVQVNIIIASNSGYGLWFAESDISVVGFRATGVKAIQLKDDEYVMAAHAFNEWSDQSFVL